MMAKLHGMVDHLFREPVRATTSAPASDVDPRYAAAVVDLALRAAEMAVQTGAVTSDAISFALTITAAYGLTADVDVTFTSVTISYHRRGKAEPITGFRGVRQRNTNYTQLTQLLRLIDDIGTGRLGLDAARDRLDGLRSNARPYRVWVITLGQALTGVGVAAILGGRPGEMLLAALANSLMFLVQLTLTRTQLSVFFIQALGAAVPTAMAVWIMHVRSGSSGVFAMVSPSLIVAAGIVTALAGVGVVAAARDAMDGNLITAGARTFDAILQTAGIIVGVAITLWVGLKLGVQGYIAPTAGYASPSALQIVWAILIAVGLAFGFQLGLRALPFVAILAAAGFAVYQWSLPYVGNWPAAAALGAIVVGFMSQFIVGRFRIPLVALVTAGVVALMPGAALYRGLYELILTIDEPISVQAQISLGNAVMVALGLAAGSTFGAQIARPVGLPTARLFRMAEQRTLRRSRRSTISTELAR
ncbi:threonine/serine exporter family protein [Tessaracoccus antarcticus]|uniref:Threonine/serine exporter family protein n=1 Tax=Tessaracoccus antarcticus TaxID=2479848 RepID=A0A3M0GAE3_9ACTN|nr:threonine/serine exporter family protein [Tessaracoccus antarcticus]RMB61985.1 threonine/serine exporter family protein [Tessaracoccus antarcticus]